MRVPIRNHHRRTLRHAVPAAALLDGLAGADDRLWPHERWPPLRLDRPLQMSARGEHGPIPYRVEAYEPGTRVRFRFERLDLYRIVLRDPDAAVRQPYVLPVMPVDRGIRSREAKRPSCGAEAAGACMPTRTGWAGTMARWPDAPTGYDAGQARPVTGTPVPEGQGRTALVTPPPAGDPRTPRPEGDHVPMAPAGGWPVGVVVAVEMWFEPDVVEIAAGGMRGTLTIDVATS